MNVQTQATPARKGKKLTFWGLALAPFSVWLTAWAQRNPLTAVVVIAGWELVLAAVTFGQDVWAKVRPSLVDRAANAVTFWIDCLLSGHRKRYLQDVIYQHRNFDVKGLSTQATFTLELEQVFVDLRVAPTAPHQASADMIRKLPPELKEGRHQVWDFLGGLGGGAAKLVLLGAPGSGKTTLVKHVALTFARGRSPRPKLRASRNLPLLLFLREHAEAIASNPDAKLSELVAWYQKEKRQLDVPASWFDSQLQRKRCLVMLDGLDEVADPKVREKVAVWVDRQMSIHAGNPFIITSRPHGYRDNPLSGVNVLDVRPFTSEQVRDFVQRWYVANEIKSQQRDDRGVRQDARKGARDLLERLHATPALSDLAVNPLLLTMIATVHRYRSSLPGRRVELYAEICEVSLGKRQQSKGIQLDLTPAQKQRVLEPLAWRMMVEKKRGIAVTDACDAIKDILLRVRQQLAPADFLSSVENDSSLLVEKEAGGTYAFAHLTFQEFLAACHAHQNEHRAVGEPDRINLLIHNVGKGWWAECIRLFAATGDATPILRACIKDRALDPEALALALQCMEEAQLRDPALEAELGRIVEAGLNEADPTKRKPIAEALLKVCLSRMRRLDESRYIGPELVSHAEYQLFVDEERAKGRDRRPIHWTDDRFPTGQGRTPVLGLSFVDAWRFCEWLTERQGGQWRFRLPTAEEARSVEPQQTGGVAIATWTTPNRQAPAENLLAGPRAALWPEPLEEEQRATAMRGIRIASGDLCAARALAFQRDFAHGLVRYLSPETIADLADVVALTPAEPLLNNLRHALDVMDTPTLKSVHKPTRVLDRDPPNHPLDLEIDGARTLELDLKFAFALARLYAQQAAVLRYVGGSDHPSRDYELFRRSFRKFAGRAEITERDPITLLALLLAVAQSDQREDERTHRLVRARNMGLILLFSFEFWAWSVGSWFRQQALIRIRRLVRGMPLEMERDRGYIQEVILILHMAAKLSHSRITRKHPAFEALRVVRERDNSNPGAG